MPVGLALHPVVLGAVTEVPQGKGIRKLVRIVLLTCLSQIFASIHFRFKYSIQVWPHPFPQYLEPAFAACCAKFPAPHL